MSFEQISGKHTGANLAERIFTVLDQYNIAEKLFGITTDNASNNFKCMKKLSKLLYTNKGVHWNAKELHISCLNHVINLAVQDFLRAIKALDRSTDEPQVELITEGEDENTGEEYSDSEENDLYDDVEVIEQTLEESMDVIEGEEGFKSTMWKLRQIAKVFVPCSIQIHLCCDGRCDLYATYF